MSETLGNMRDAEQFFRRAYAIASAARPADDPLVSTSLQNLKDFCDARGLPLEDWPGIPQELPRRRPAAPPPPPAPAHPAPRPVATAPETSAAPRGEGHDTPARHWTPALVGLAVIAAALVAGRAWLSTPDAGRSASNPPSTMTPTPPASQAVPEPPAGAPVATPPPAVAPVATPPPEIAAAPVEPGRVTTAPPGASRPADPPSPAATPAVRGRDPVAGVRVVAADICASLTTAGAWRCTPLATPARPVRASFYTRVAARTALRIEHRWYKDTVLRQRVSLSIAANPSDGYRTFSRQTITAGRWRVELRTADGTLLHETSFEVQ